MAELRREKAIREEGERRGEAARDAAKEGGAWDDSTASAAADPTLTRVLAALEEILTKEVFDPRADDDDLDEAYDGEDELDLGAPCGDDDARGIDTTPCARCCRRDPAEPWGCLAPACAGRRHYDGVCRCEGCAGNGRCFGHGGAVWRYAAQHARSRGPPGDSHARLGIAFNANVALVRTMLRHHHAGERDPPLASGARGGKRQASDASGARALGPSSRARGLNAPHASVDATSHFVREGLEWVRGAG